ncbi:unnamed protein product [Adineta ricciae]|uniref:Glycosyl hydrolase family 13 catalytic domain-containing protein n=1 Tax=Adineta ricciae TaxID=249248 RepID=A0A816DW46_ADIRI|nr:unnamed protein product [Adineta ricciae]CAF1639858.1 unnamed protein product [Adineta ricciae]
MDETIVISDPDVLRDEVHQPLFNETEIGFVHRNGDEQKSETIGELVQYKKPKENQQFIGLTKEELKEYLNNPKWKRIRWTIACLYILLVVSLLIGSIVLIVISPRCRSKPHLNWYEKEIIYEIDVPSFYDSNDDGIGDIKGVKEKLKYFQENRIKSLLFRSTIFSSKTNFMSLDSSVGSESDLQDFMKTLYKKDMHFLVDLPLASTWGTNDHLWFNSTARYDPNANHPCSRDEHSFGCRFRHIYRQIPLDFSNEDIYRESESRIKYWLMTQKADGIRVNLPLEYVPSAQSYEISYNTIHKWNKLKNDIEKKTKSKVILYDIPFDLQNLIDNEELHNRTAYSLHFSPHAQEFRSKISSLEDKRLSKPKFWQLGPERRNDHTQTLNQYPLAKETVMTTTMLIGGTPIVLYGEEIGLDQRFRPLMSWSPDGPSGGFSKCSTADCQRRFSYYQNDPSRTSVKRQEALGGESKDSLLILFRQLSQLRLNPSFQHGLVQTGCQLQSGLFWFIREAPGHRGFVVLVNLNSNPQDFAHISLYSLTKEQVPLHIHNEYQWPKYTLPKSHEIHINSDNLLIQSQSINIFSWTPKMVKPDVLYQHANQHSQYC